MKIFIPSSGAREHALAWQFQKFGHKVFTDPLANAGMRKVAKVLDDVDRENPESLLALAEKEYFDLTVIGGETLLQKRIVNLFENYSHPIVGPTYEAARLTELSKWECCKMLEDAGVLIPRTTYCEDLKEAIKVLNERGQGVGKPDEGTLGKGVFVMEHLGQIKAAVEHLSQYPGRFLVQDLIGGWEVSFFVATDGRRKKFLGSAADHKRLLEGNRGPMTGGMGVFSPHNCMTPALHDRIMHKVVEPTLKELIKREAPFRGGLYFQLMLTEDGGIYVIEINARFGAPEAEVLMPLYEGDLARLLASTCKGQILDASEFSICADKAIGVVAAAEGYGGPKVRKGDVIEGLDLPGWSEFVFHGGTKLLDNGQVVTDGGRVLTVVSRQSSFEEAFDKVYERMRLVRYPGIQYRSDIRPWRGLDT